MPGYYRPKGHPVRPMRVYLRFSKKEYALLERMAQVQNRKAADLLRGWVLDRVQVTMESTPGLASWFDQACRLIDLEEQCDVK